MTYHILSVDDSATVRKLIRVTFESRGWRVKTAENGLEALASLQHESFDAIILDINMPGMNGLEFLQNIKSNKSLVHIPIVVLTTEQQEDVREKALVLGATAYWVKPFDPDHLFQRLEEVCS